LGIGLLTPPVGPTMVVGCAIGRVSMEAVSRSILIFYVPMLIVLLLVTYIPALTLWLPSVVLGKYLSKAGFAHHLRPFRTRVWEALEIFSMCRWVVSNPEKRWSPFQFDAASRPDRKSAS